MSGCGHGDTNNVAWVKKTLIYRRWEAMREDILRHKWYESEKVGHDIGWDRAVVDWMIKYGGMRLSENPSEKQTT